MGQSTAVTLVRAEDLHDFACRAFVAAGVSANDAEVTADSMVQASLRGEGDHGARLINIWCQKIKAGGTNPRAPIEVVREHSSTALLDAQNGIGAVAATRAMGLAIDKARSYGMGWVAVRNSNSLGSAKHYALMAVAQRMVGICLSNSNPLLVPPGGLNVKTGTNPIAIAAPARTRYPVVLDMACSQSAYERIHVYASQGRQIPPGWAVDPEGKPVSDPRDIAEGAFAGGGGLLGIGDRGYKGFGLSVLVNVLTGVLGGGAYCEGMSGFSPYDTPERDSFALVALNIENFMPYEEFIERVDDFVAVMKDCALIPGVDAVHLPGEQGYSRAVTRRSDGLPLDEPTATGLRDLARELDIAGLCGLDGQPVGIQTQVSR